jgi:hypothetical protein
MSRSDITKKPTRLVTPTEVRLYQRRFHRMLISVGLLVVGTAGLLWLLLHALHL